MIFKIEKQKQMGIIANIGKLGESIKNKASTFNKHISIMIDRLLKSPANPYLQTVVRHYKTDNQPKLEYVMIWKK